MNTRNWTYMDADGRKAVADWRKSMAQRWMMESTKTLKRSLNVFESPYWRYGLYEVEMQARVIRKILSRR